ncbi:MAG TPA: acetate/propionate family kinase [Candidatus Saccharimonadales bacterium]
METTNSSDTYILTVNAGSSSIKLALFAARDITQKVLEASIEGIGLSSTNLVTPDGKKPVAAGSHSDAAMLLIEWLTAQVATTSMTAVGHRIVHGGPDYHEAIAATDEVLADLRKLAAFDPEHLPVELELVTVFQEALPQARQVLSFDTAFHHDLPTSSRLLPIPRHFEAKGVRRYGFHGLSYAYILEELRRVEGETAANGKVIIAHLGNGASLVALKNGKPIDTTMSMTPVSGIAMSTRAGDLDPGLALYFARTQGYDAERFNHMVNFESGLLGISETTADMKKLLEIEGDNERAKDAVDMFCYQTKKSVGSFAAALGGLNTLVFTGGIGENAPRVRARICEGLDFLGITIDDTRNQQGNRLISADGSQVGVHVIHTDEAVTMARETAELIKRQAEQRGGL